MPARVVILLSGSGTLAQALMDDAARSNCAYVVVGVVSDRADAYGLVRARERGIPISVVSPGDHPDRPGWDRALADAVATFSPNWVVSAGFMRILGSAFLARFGGRVINTHPALLPAFPGAHGVRDALTYGVRVTGCTVHFVDAGVDTGPIIAQEAVTVLPDDTVESLHERIKAVERRMLVDVVNELAGDRLHLEGGRVTRT